METKIKLYQPLFYSTLKEKIMNSTSISKPARMDICEFSLNVKAPHSLSIIPSPFCEWIIGYNKNNMKSSFYCLGSVSELTTIELKHYDYYIDIRFDDNVCYVNKLASSSANSSGMRNQQFEYAPKPDSFEYTLLKEFKESTSFSDKVQYFTKFLLDSKRFCFIPEHVDDLYTKLKRSNGAITVHELSEESGYSERHINRLISNQFGYGPKDYCKYIRFQRVLNEMINSPDQSNSEFIQNIGYSDQAHFQREFKLFMGMTPKQFIRLL